MIPESIKQNIYQTLHASSKFYSKENTEGYKEGIEEVMNFPSKYGLEQVREWIPVENGNIPEGVDILCFAVKIPSPKYNETFIASYEDGKFVTGKTEDYNNNSDYFFVTHWKLLPTPPTTDK
jgi:hypothetical protein